MPNKGVLLCFVSAVLAGYAAHALGVPLAWVLGPLVATAGFAIAGVAPFAPSPGRWTGQVIIGAAIGLNVTPAVIGTLAGWLPVMVFTALLSMLVGSACAIALARFARVDLKTAYFCMMPGGLSEMANIGAAHGARHEAIALSQALRVALVVCILPPLLVALGLEGEFYERALIHHVPLHILPLLGIAGLTGVLAAKLLRFNNPWMIGSLIGVGVATAFGYFDGRLPRELFYAGQFLLGISIGARFRREVVITLGRLALVSSSLVLVMTAGMFLYAGLLAYLGGIGIASAGLSASPGGFAEMAVTAEALHLNVTLVTAFHVIRATLVNGFTTYYFDFLGRVGFFQAGGRLLARLL
jgi:membrane AbrB-like protein